MDFQVLERAFQERTSHRGIARTFECAHGTIQRLARKRMDKTPELCASLSEQEAEEALELDEVYTFYGKKCNKIRLWIVFGRTTRKILAWHLGDGSEKSCQDLWEKLPSRYKTITSYSDFWKSYNILNDKTHTLVGKETGQTNHVERWNGTLRQRHVSFVRKSLSFAKKLEFLEKRCLFFCYNYNVKEAPRIARQAMLKITKSQI